MAKAIMIQGTASNSGKTLLAAGLCRIFWQDGWRVAPFKSQNMALNSYITADGKEMGRAQVMQAEAAGLVPDVRMNPILLKPTSDKGSQVIVNGSAIGNMSAAEYFAMKRRLLPDIRKAYESLAAENDIIVIEGAGSPAEINLKQGDIVNMGMAALAKAPVLIAGDIDRGGVFAALAGTMLLLDESEKKLVKGVIVNKFRGDVEILRPGLEMLEDLIKVPVLGVVPYLDVKVDDEDSLTERFAVQNGPGLVDIAVIRLPRISNFTDFNALEYIDGVSLRYVRSRRELGQPDLIILPGSKNTMEDLVWLRQSGLEAALMRHAAKSGPVLGICGGFQMLGRHIADPQGMESGGEAEGLGLLSCSTVFGREKQRLQVSGCLAPVGGIFQTLSGLPFNGYEIHMGVSANELPCRQTGSQSTTGSCANLVQEGNIYGTYLHGIFDTEEVSGALVAALLAAKGLDAAQLKSFNMEAFKDAQYEALAAALRESLDMQAIYRIIDVGV